MNIYSFGLAVLFFGTFGVGDSGLPCFRGMQDNVHRLKGVCVGKGQCLWGLV